MGDGRKQTIHERVEVVNEGMKEGSKQTRNEGLECGEERGGGT